MISTPHRGSRWIPTRGGVLALYFLQVIWVPPLENHFNLVYNFSKVYYWGIWPLLSHTFHTGGDFNIWSWLVYYQHKIGIPWCVYTLPPWKICLTNFWYFWNISNSYSTYCLGGLQCTRSLEFTEILYGRNHIYSSFFLLLWDIYSFLGQCNS